MEYTFNIGVDVSKKALDVCFGEQASLTVENSHAGFNVILKRLSNTTPVQVVMEATDGYERSFVGFLPPAWR